MNFLIITERFKLNIKSAENKEYQIKYIDYNGVQRTYFPDYIINDKYLVEVKPKKLWSTIENKLKFKAAKELCNERNLIFKLFDFGKPMDEIIIQQYNNKKIKFIEIYDKKFRKEYKRT